MKTAGNSAMRLPTKTNLGSITRGIFRITDFGSNAFCPYWHSDLHNCDPAAIISNLDCWTMLVLALLPVTLVLLRPPLQGQAEELPSHQKEPSSSQSSLPPCKLEADYVRAVMHKCCRAKAFLSYEEIYLEAPNNGILSFYPSFLEETTQARYGSSFTFHSASRKSPLPPGHALSRTHSLLHRGEPPSKAQHCLEEAPTLSQSPSLHWQAPSGHAPSAPMARSPGTPVRCSSSFSGTPQNF